MKIISWNINGYRRLDKSRITDLIAYEVPDIIFLQEMKMTDPDPIEEIENFDCYYNLLTPRSAGVVGYIRADIPHEILETTEGDVFDGRLIAFELANYFVVNTYVPHSGGKLEKLDYRIDTWDTALHKFLRKLQKTKPVIWCGDLNVARDPIDLRNPKSNRNRTAGYTDRERESFAAFLKKAHMVDVFRELHPDTEMYSFWTWRKKDSREKNVGWRLDYFVVSEVLMDQVRGTEILKGVEGSDHAPIILDMSS